MKRRMTFRQTLSIVTGCLILLLQGCSAKMSGDNDDFRIWCGDHPCAWRVEEGDVEPAPTWHRSAKGIAFLDDPTAISQVIEFNDASIIELWLLGELEEKAAFFWEIDFNNDGMDDDDPTIVVDELGWKTKHLTAEVPEGCTTARVILRKTGKGLATLASAEFSSDGEGYYYGGYDYVR